MLSVVDVTAVLAGLCFRPVALLTVPGFVSPLLPVLAAADAFAAVLALAAVVLVAEADLARVVLVAFAGLAAALAGNLAVADCAVAVWPVAVPIIASGASDFAVAAAIGAEAVLASTAPLVTVRAFAASTSTTGVLFVALAVGVLAELFRRPVGLVVPPDFALAVLALAVLALASVDPFVGVLAGTAWAAAEGFTLAALD